MTTSLRCVPPPLPVSAMYKHDWSPHGATLTSSQSLTFAPTMRTRPSTSPDGLRAVTLGAPESFSDHSTDGWRRLSARPLASGKVGNFSRDSTSHPSDFTDSSAAAASAVLAARCPTAYQTTTAATPINVAT